jgi:hypothetical protein
MTRRSGVDIIDIPMEDTLEVWEGSNFDRAQSTDCNTVLEDNKLLRCRTSRCRRALHPYCCRHMFH